MSEHEAMLRALASERTSQSLISRVQRDPVAVVDAARWAVNELNRLQASDWESLSAGDPDPTGPEGDCPAVGQRGLLCTRDTGHPGQHIAGCGDYIAATWTGPDGRDPR